MIHHGTRRLRGGIRHALVLFLLLSCLGSAGWADVKSVSLNGTTIGVDTVTGGIVLISNPSVGRVLEAHVESASLVDLAYPTHQFSPLRLGARFSKARLSAGKDELVITWDRLGPSRNDHALPEGHVSAEARLRAAPNGRSIILTCRIENRSAEPVPQIMFPDLEGFLPFGGLSRTVLTISGMHGYPFAKPVRSPHTASFYGKSLGLIAFDPPGGNLDGLGRVYLAGRSGGVSVFQKANRQPASRIFTQRREANPESLRLMWEHQDSIAPGQTWESAEYWITPFKGTLSAGIPNLKKLSLNGLEIAVDADSGNIVNLSHPETGLLLDCESWLAGIVEVGLAAEKDDPLDELSSTYSSARVEESGGGIDITWDGLRPAAPQEGVASGGVGARVSIRPAPDKKSVILSCEISNNTQTPVRLVRFPDLHNLQPAGDASQTRVRLSRDGYFPFREKAGNWTEKPNPLSWLDYGSYKSGISIFQRKWNRSFLEYRPTVMTYLSDAASAGLRLAVGHRVVVGPGETWQSGEFWLTPHNGGWAKGIEPFRDYVRKVRVKREVPKRVAEELGFRTVWMTQPAETLTERAAFTFKDLPAIAKEASEHGLYEVVPWFWCPNFELPIKVRSELGTRDEFIAGIRAARDMGVSITPFISVNIIRDDQAAKYGGVPSSADWTYHTEAIPMFRPYYTKHQTGARLGGGTSNISPVWIHDVEETLLDWIGLGVTSFCWDLWYSHPELLEMIGRVRKTAQARDPESSFAGEIHSFEQDGEVLDYTWNWANYLDSTPIISVLPYPRFNCNVEASPMVARMAFCDGLHLNVMPKKPDQPNATAFISERPELSKALRECAKLRKQFLGYFLEGVLLGDAVLCEPADAFVRGHQLGRSLLVFVVNNGDVARSIAVKSDLAVWLPGADRYEVTRYDTGGAVVERRPAEGPVVALDTGSLPEYGLAIFEIAAVSDNPE